MRKKPLAKKRGRPSRAEKLARINIKEEKTLKGYPIFDEDEMITTTKYVVSASNERRLHLGNGTIYLKGFTNIDLDQLHHYLAHERPDLVEENGTTVDNYYREDVNRNTIEAKSRHFNPVVCDMFADIRNLPFQEGTISEIRLVQVFEHFTYAEGAELLAKWFKLLKVGGKLHIDVPDLAGTIELYSKADNDEDRAWATRLLFGSQKNEWGIHKGMYTPITIMEAMEKAGFKGVEVLPNIHFYPAFAVEGKKL